MRALFLPFTVALCLSTIAQPCDSVDTELDRTYQNHGAMFNVVAYEPITVELITANISTNTATFQLYYRNGGFEGYETNMGAWTLLGSASVTSNNTTLTDTIPTKIPIAIDQDLMPGDTLALYLVSVPVSKVFLISTTIPWGTVQYSDANMGVSIARSCYQLFQGPFSTPQIWSGRVHYCENTSTGVEEGPDAGMVSISLAGQELLVVIEEARYSSVTAPVLEVRDMTGRLLRQERITAHRTRSQLAGLPSGAYLVMVNDAGVRIHAGRVVLQ